jgi:hypothetical protein
LAVASRAAALIRLVELLAANSTAQALASAAAAVATAAAPSDAEARYRTSGEENRIAPLPDSAHQFERNYERNIESTGGHPDFNASDQGRSPRDPCVR